MTQITRTLCGAITALPDAPADRIELIPTGTIKTADRRRPFRLDDPAAVIERSLALAPGGMLAIDFDHRTFAGQGKNDSRAAGWIKGMEVEGGRVMASVEWTPEGRKALADRAYRFISPVFDNLPDGKIVRIGGAGLVNNPALPQLRQLASQEQDMDPIQQIAGIVGLAADKPDDIVVRVTALAAAETQLTSIATAAGVTGDDAVTQICARLTARAPDPAQFVPMAQFTALQTQFASLQADVQKDRVEEALEKARAAGKLIPAMEDWATQLASQDLAQFEAWAAAAPAVVPLGQRQLAGATPPPARSDTLTDTERQLASTLGLKPEDYLATRNEEA